MPICILFGFSIWASFWNFRKLIMSELLVQIMIIFCSCLTIGYFFIRLYLYVILFKLSITYKLSPSYLSTMFSLTFPIFLYMTNTIIPSIWMPTTIKLFIFRICPHTPDMSNVLRSLTTWSAPFDNGYLLLEFVWKYLYKFYFYSNIYNQVCPVFSYTFLSIKSELAFHFFFMEIVKIKYFWSIVNIVHLLISPFL